MSNNSVVYRRAGHCPICGIDVEFSAKYDWYRDHLVCSNCGSIPRERALALVLSRRFPDWRDLAIHESSPGTRGISPKLKRECAGYVETQHFRGEPLGKMVDGVRNENLEVLTFPDQSFDIVVTLDVMEHLNEPRDALCEIARTLKPGGSYIFTTPTYNAQPKSERQARYGEDGTAETKPEDRGNPTSDAGSLVTFHYGYDFAELINQWSNMDVEVVRFHDHYQGIIGEFTEVYVATKRSTGLVAGRNTGEAGDDWPPEVRQMCETSARPLGVSAEVHRDDFIFRFTYDNPVFPTKDSAVDYYFQDGSNSAAKLRRLIDRWASGNQGPLSVLEFAAGYGAVTRHAKAALVPHVLHSSDIHPQANRFLSEILAVEAIQSAEVPEELALPRTYDVIFALSFFSHMPRSTWGRWLQRLYAGLEKGGILIFTTHGRASMKHLGDVELDESGFWFTASSEQADLATATYGLTLTTKEFVDARIAELPGVEHVHDAPAAWWDHQDLYIVRKT